MVSCCRWCILFPINLIRGLKHTSTWAVSTLGSGALGFPFVFVKPLLSRSRRGRQVIIQTDYLIVVALVGVVLGCGREHVRTKTRNMPPAAAAARRCGFPTCYSAGLTLGQRHAQAPLDHSPSPTQPRFPDSQSQSRGPQSPRARSLPAHAMIIIGGSLSTALVMSAARRQGTPDALGTCRGINAAASLARRRLASPRPGHPFHRAAAGGGWPRRKPGGSHRRELAASFRLGERGRHSTFHITTWQWHMR